MTQQDVDRSNAYADLLHDRITALEELNARLTATLREAEHALDFWSEDETSSTLRNLQALLAELSVTPETQ